MVDKVLSYLTSQTLLPEPQEADSITSVLQLLPSPANREAKRDKEFELELWHLLHPETGTLKL